MKILDRIIKKSPAKESLPVEMGEQKRNFAEGLVATKDIIAPGSLEVDFDHVRIDNKYYRTLFVAGYPRFVGMNWLSPLVNFDASLAVSMYIYPTDGKEILDDLRRKITEMEAEINTDIQRGRVVNPSTQAKLEDALALQADLVKGEERFFQFGLYVTISAESIEEINRINKNLEAALGSLMIISKRATLQMEDGFVSTLPICSDRINITRNMDTTSLATTFPFVSSDLSDDRGIMYGINEHNGSLVIFDRFSMPNYNSVVLATAGGGKSYLIKLEALRSLMLGTEIIVIDPENEYRNLCEAVGGQYIAFGYGEASKINPFDLSLVTDEEENALNSKILTLHKLFKVMIGEMDPMEESILDKAIMDAYKMKGISPDPETQNKEPPLIEDMYKSLIGMEEEKAKNLAARLEKYIKGSFAGIFNQKTTVNLNNSFVVFGIRNLEDALRPIAMQIVLDYIWTIVKKSLKKRILIVDEAWYLMQFPDSAAFLRGIVKRSRKYYLGVTTITQDTDDFLQTAYGKEIVTNSAIQILLKQHSAAIDQVGEVFYLSEGEKQLLLAADKGEGIFFAGQNHVAIRVIASEEEHRLITSNPEELMKMKAQGPKVGPPVVPPTPVAKPQTQATPSTPASGAIMRTEVVGEPTFVPTYVGTSTFAKATADKPAGKEEKPEEVIQRKISVLEEKEKKELAAFAKASSMADKSASQGESKIPKYQQLFKSENKLPPLPPLPKFEPPKVEVKDNKTKGPVFINKSNVVTDDKWPQPPQLAKKPKIVFEPIKTDEEKKTEDKSTFVETTADKAKLNYEDLFGGGKV